MIFVQKVRKLHTIGVEILNYVPNPGTFQTSLTDRTIEMPTAQTGKRNNILKTQGHGKVYCFKAEDEFRKEIMLKADFLMNSQEQQRIRSQWKQGHRPAQDTST